MKEKYDSAYEITKPPLAVKCQDNNYRSVKNHEQEVLANPNVINIQKMNNIIGKMVHNSEVNSECEYKTTAETVVKGAKTNPVALTS